MVFNRKQHDFLPDQHPGIQERGGWQQAQQIDQAAEGAAIEHGSGCAEPDRQNPTKWDKTARCW